MIRKLFFYLLLSLPMLGLSLQAQGEGEAPNPNYIIQPSDVLRFVVFQEPDLEQQFRVPQDGRYQFPLIGAVMLRGKTVKEAEDLIRELYDRDFLVNPQVNLLIMEYSQRRVNVLGAVNQPGTVVFPPEEEMTVLDAISRAGGFNRLSNRRSVQLSRTGADGRVTRFTINADEIMRGSASSAWKLERDDIIFVPERTF
jgi:polysaccharide biosynthesis/export protein